MLGTRLWTALNQITPKDDAVVQDELAAALAVVGLRSRSPTAATSGEAPCRTAAPAGWRLLDVASDAPSSRRREQGVGQTCDGMARRSGPRLT